MKKYRKILVAVALVLMTMAIIIYWADHKIKNLAEGKTFDSSVDIPYNKAGLLLGTSKLLKSGRVNLYFQNRIIAASELYRSGKINKIIISGDNGNKEYDEPTDMKKELIKQGVDSTHIYLDYAGFRTYDSMVRVKEIFGQGSITVISQKFHNERAIYIAEQIGLKAIGYNAKDVSKYYGIKTSIRELFARVKAITDIMMGVKPKFLGEKIEIK